MTRDWVIKKLKDLGDIQTGTTPPTKDKSYYGDYIPFIKPANFEEDGSIRYDDLGLSEEGLKKGRLIKEDSILMVCIGATIGKTGITTTDVSCNQQINSFTPNENLYSKFFYYALSCDSFQDKVLRSASQATLPIINKSKWENLDVAFPKSFEEQKEIVAKLDEAFAAIDVAKANIEKNIGNARELFQSRLNEIFSRKGDGWEEKKLGDVAELKGRIGWRGLTAKEYTEEGPLFLSVHSLNYGDYVDFRDAFHITDERYEESPEIMLKTGDVLICKDGAGIGKLGIVGNLPDKATVNSSLLVIRGTELVKAKYLYYSLLSPFFQRIVQNRLQGATTPHLYQRDITTFPIFLPSLEEQELIIQKIDSLNQNYQNLNCNYQQKLTNLEELKKSLLQKAFAGELT